MSINFVYIITCCATALVYLVCAEKLKLAVVYPQMDWTPVYVKIVVIRDVKFA